MISIKTTPKFNGIAIQGDFDDLNQLYDAISEYSNFYLNGILHEIESAYVKEHGVPIADMTPEQKNEYFNLHDFLSPFYMLKITFYCFLCVKISFFNVAKFQYIRIAEANNFQS